MRPYIIQVISNCATSASMIFIPLFAEELGANYFDIGIIGACYGISIFISSYLFGRLSDIYGRKFILEIGLIAARFTFFAQSFAFSPMSLSFIRFIAGFCAGIFPASLATYIYESARKLGKFAAFGSLGWAIGNFSAGLIASYFEIFTLSSVFFFLAFIAAIRLPKIGKRMELPFFSSSIIKKNLSIYLSFFLRHLGANAIWIIFPLYLKYLGADYHWIGILYAINSSTQFIAMWIGDRFDSEKLIITGLILSSITFFSFSIATNFYQILPMQIMLGLSWGSLYLGSLKYVMERNIEKATATGALNSSMSLAVAMEPIFGGFLSQLYGFKSTMFIGCALSIIASIIFLMMNSKN